MWTNSNQRASRRDSKEQWTDALCQLNGIPWPFKVVVCSEIPPKLGDNIEARRIRLYKKDLSMLGEHMTYWRAGMWIKYEIVVPENWIIQTVTCEENAEDLSNKSEYEYKLVLRDYYRSISLRNVGISDIVVWVPTPADYNRSELISCVLYFAGRQTTEPYSAYAFVCPQKGVSESTIIGNLQQDIIQGWGKVYRVPLSDIYRLEDINQVRRRVAAEFPHVKLECREVRGESEYEYFYNFCQLKSGHKPLTKTKESLNESMTEDTLGQDKRTLAGLVRADNPKKNFSNTCDPDDRNQIPGGKVEEARQHFSMNDGNGKTHSSTQLRTASVNEDLNKIILFGNCFAAQDSPKKVSIDEVKPEDLVVASLDSEEDENVDNVMGKVVIACEIPSLKAKQVFIGIKFEENVNFSPFEVRHVWGEETLQCSIHCKGGKNVFIPIEHLLNTNPYLRLIKNPTKFNQAKNPTPISEIQVNFTYEASRRDYVRTPIDGGSLKGKLRNIGIEGKANSCYIDAVLFALYAFTNKFDEGLLKHVRSTKHSAEMSEQIEAARNVLKYDIVSPLRSLLKVDWEHVYKLRLCVSKILNDKSYLGNFMDAEAFIVSLFSEVLQVPEFFQLGEDTRDYILQLFPPIANENAEENKIDRSCVQSLLEEYFLWTGVKLQEVPKVGFIIKLPVSNGVRHFKYVYPNPKLRLGETLLEKTDKNERFMTLRAVICLKKNHFTCFVRTETNAAVADADTTGGKATWYFHDSMTEGPTILTECPYLEIALETAAPHFGIKVLGDGYSGREYVGLEEANKWLDILLTTAYICVYEPPRHETYCDYANAKH